MGTPVEAQDPQIEEGQAEEATQGDAGESVADTGASEESGWSIKDVPLELRPHVEKAIKPFHSRTTKAEQAAREYEKKLKEIEPKLSNLDLTAKQMESLRGQLYRLVTDDDYRKSIRSQYGIKEQEKNSQGMPEGWESPEAVTARKLLFNEVVKGIEETYGFKLSELPKVFNAAQGFESRVVQDAQKEITSTEKAVTEEGLPWSAEILDSCIQVVGRMKANGQSISLREAYDALRKPFIEAEQKKAASTDSKIKEKLPFKPAGKGGEQKLTGDALLRNVINDLGVPGSFND